MAKESEAVLESVSRLCYALEGLTREISGMKDRIPAGNGLREGSSPESDEPIQEDLALHEDDEQGEGFEIGELALMHPKTLLDKQRLAQLLAVTSRTIQRMVERSEIPPPITFRKRSFWMAGHVLRHIESQVEEAAKEAERMARQYERLRP